MHWPLYAHWWQFGHVLYLHYPRTFRICFKTVCDNLLLLIGIISSFPVSFSNIRIIFLNIDQGVGLVNTIYRFNVFMLMSVLWNFCGGLPCYFVSFFYWMNVFFCTLTSFCLLFFSMSVAKFFALTSIGFFFYFGTFPNGILPANMCLGFLCGRIPKFHFLAV